MEKIKILLDIFWVLFQAASDVEKRTHYENRLFKMPRRARWFKGKEQFSKNTWTYAPRLQNLFTTYCFRVPDEATFCAHVLVVASHTNTPTTSGLAGELQNFHSLMWKRVCLQEVWCKWGPGMDCPGCVLSSHHGSYLHYLFLNPSLLP